MGPCSRTPSRPAVSTDCVNRPDRRLHSTNATTSNYLLQCGSHPQKTFAWLCEEIRSGGTYRQMTRHQLSGGAQGPDPVQALLQDGPPFAGQTPVSGTML